MSRKYKASTHRRRAFYRYTYESFKSMDMEHEDQVSFFGTVIDACFPYKIDNGRYMCNLKVVDKSLNIAKNSEDFAIVIMTARRFEDLPII